MPFTPTEYPHNHTGGPLRGEALRAHRRQLGRWSFEQSMLRFLDMHAQEGRTVPDALREGLLRWASEAGCNAGHTAGQHHQTIINLTREQMQSQRTIEALVYVHGVASKLRRMVPDDHPDAKQYDEAAQAAVDVARLNACEPE